MMNSYKRKVQFLIIGFITFLVLAYSVSIRRTIILYDECAGLEKQTEIISNAPMLIAQLEARQKGYDLIIGRNIQAGINFQKALLEKVSQFCASNHLVLRDFPEVRSFKSGDYLLDTYEVAIEGNFFALVRLVYGLEQEWMLGKIISLKYETFKDNQSGQVRLIARIYIQNIKRSANETQT